MKWIIVIHGTDIDTIVYEFAGTEQEAKELLIRLAKEDKDQDTENWSHGTEAAEDIDYLDDGGFYAYGAYETGTTSYIIDYVAKPQDAIRQIPNPKEVSK